MQIWSHRLQFYICTKAPHTECRVQRFCERSLDSVEKLHAIRDAVKCKCPCCVIQVDPDTRWHGTCNICAFIIMNNRVLGIWAVKAPGLVIPSQAAFVPVSLTANSLVRDGNVYLRAIPLHLPVTRTPSNALSAQHLEENDQCWGRTSAVLMCWAAVLKLHLFHVSVNSYLLPVVKSVWVGGVILGLTLHGNCPVPLGEVKVGVNTVDLQKQLARV